MEHTKGRIKQRAVTADGCTEAAKIIKDSEGNEIARIDYRAMPTGSEGIRLSDGNARRLVACWNYCEGISTQELEERFPEAQTLTREYRADRARLQALNAELVAALEGAYEAIVLQALRDRDDKNMLEGWKAVQAPIVAALAKSKEAQS